MDEIIIKKNEEVKQMLNNIPTGKPKSGKLWKERRKRSHTELKIGSLKTSFADKMKKRAERKSVKDFEKRLKEEKMKEIEIRRQKTKEKRQRKLENERKNEIVTVIKNPAKIKRTKKKLLRTLKPNLK